MEQSSPSPYGLEIPDIRELDEPEKERFLDGYCYFARSEYDSYKLTSHVNAAIRLIRKREHVRALLHHIMLLKKSVGRFDARYVDRWIFPDGHCGYLGYVVIQQDGKDAAITHVSYADREGPAAILDLVQGVKGEQVRLEDAVAPIVRSWKPLHRAGWQLSFAYGATGASYPRVRDRYFSSDPSILSSDIQALPEYLINTRRKRVRELWSMDGTDPATLSPS